MAKEPQAPIHMKGDEQIDTVFKFLASIDWTERWLQYVVLFHVITFLLILLSRNYLKTQIAFFTMLLASVLCTEGINEYLAKNFAAFSRQQYFDSEGMFISLVWSAPVLVNCVAILINWFLFSGKMLVDVKQRELKEKEKEKSKKHQ